MQTSQNSQDKILYATKNMSCRLDWTHRIMIRELSNERKSKCFVISSRGSTTVEVFNELKAFCDNGLHQILIDNVVIDGDSKSATHIVIVIPRKIKFDDKSYSFVISYPHQFLYIVAAELSKFLCRGQVAFRSIKRSDAL